MSSQESLRIISVTGAHSSVGKTTLCSLLLRNLHNFGAIKFTKNSMFTSISDDPETISVKGKDTAVMSDAGAKKVIWIQSPYDGLQECLDIALSKMQGLKGVVVEGNSPVDFINPDIHIFIIGPEGNIKESADSAIKKANVIVINAEKIPDNTDAYLSHIKAERFEGKEIFWIDLVNIRGEIDKILTFVEKMLTKKLN